MRFHYGIFFLKFSPHFVMVILGPKSCINELATFLTYGFDFNSDLGTFITKVKMKQTYMSFVDAVINFTRLVYRSNRWFSCLNG